MRTPSIEIFLILTFISFNDSYKIEKSPPNIVLIIADDMGFNDVSFRGSNQFLTPNIDALAYNGMILNKYYVPALCTPSRATLLTGKFPIHTGTQHFVIPNDEPWGLPLNETTMPEIFQRAGYSTNLIGKWHLGFFKKAYTPTLRGFDYHYGYYGGYIDYWDHTLLMGNKNYGRGYDFRQNLDVNYESNGTYATDLFTNEAVRVIRDHDKTKPLFLMLSHLAPHAGNEDDPYQAPDEEVCKFDYISDPNRRIYAAMVSRLDKSIGVVMRALSDKTLLDNTIVVFYSDNGGATVGLHANTGSNYPLRGQKDSPWEGGIRTPAVIFSPLLKNQNQLWSQVFHVSDWLPTLASAAGITINSTLNLDGINLWDQMVKGTGNENRRLVHNIDEIFKYSSYQRGPWKYINGTTIGGDFDAWLGQTSNEIDPRSNDYNRIIVESEVSKVLKTHSYELTYSKIEEMRNEAILKCPDIRNASLAYYYKCIPMIKPCLFNIAQDPCEKYNLAKEYPMILSSMEADVEYFKKTAVKSVRTKLDPNCDPIINNGLWTWWQEKQRNSDKYDDSVRMIAGNLDKNSSIRMVTNNQLNFLIAILLSYSIL